MSIKKINTGQLAERVLETRTRSQALQLADAIAADAGLMKALLGLFARGDYRLAQRASWPLGFCLEKHPELASAHLAGLLDLLKNPAHPAVTRNVLRIIQFISIPAREAGRVMGLCFSLINDPRQPVAPRAFALTVLSHLAVSYPDIIPEIRICIENQMSHAPAGFRSRAQKTLLSLARLKDHKGVDKQ